MTDPDTVGKIAEATKAVAETGRKALEQTAGFAEILQSPFRNFVGRHDDRLLQRRWKNQVLLIQDAQAFLKERGLEKLSREIPLKFGVQLVESASLEEDEEMRKTWARMLVNAGDASTDMDLRTAYIEILNGMSNFDVKVLGKLVQAALARPAGKIRAIDAEALFSQEIASANRSTGPSPIGISLANLARLGCALPGGGLDGAVVFGVVTVTNLGMGLYKACS